MVYNSFQFTWLFPLIFVFYYFIDWVTRKYCNGNSSRIGNLLLIIVSYALYIQWNVKYTLVLLGVTAVTFLGAIAIDNSNGTGGGKKLAFSLSIITLFPLLVFKYTSFLCANIQSVLGVANPVEINLIAPLGISFYTFQALGYLLDVYHGRIKAERHWWDYMLFVCFFPQTLSGPISKASDLLPQIKKKRKFNYAFAVQGLRWLLWGMFLKVVFADRLALYVNPILDNYYDYSGPSIWLASVCYSLQIYGDFAGYSLMAIGVARLMGFDLINNFQCPYLAASITEFWKRWHISLTKWLTTHIYIAMGGNRCSKIRQYGNIMTTFLVSGVWHGANWTFIVWGIIHGIVQVVEKLFGLQKSPIKIIPKLIRICVSFTIVSFAWLFFRMPSIADAYHCVLKIFTNHDGLYLPNAEDLAYLVFVSIIPIVKDVIVEFRPSLIKQMFANTVLRRAIYVVLMMIVVILGVFNADGFIYLQF